MLFFYFYLISFSLLGYGLLTNKILNINLYSFGYLGLLGISLLTIISYSTSLFIPHNYIFNSLVIFFGIFSFIIFYKKIPNVKKEFYNYLFIFSILAIFILLSKNHDDFSYYHFPYISLLTEYSHPIGIGQLNNGFRNPSSIFFISSIFYLPKIDFYLFHITPAFFLGFANLFLLKNIFDKNLFKNLKFINFLCLIFFIFINIFFYRLGEHGTDRSGLILAICLIILLLYLINNSSNLYDIETEKNIKFFSILLCLLISVKPFYLIYLPFFVVLIAYQHTRKVILKLLFSRTFFFCLFFIFLGFFYTFINSACIIFPAKFTCFSNLKWSLPTSVIEDVRIWYELWSKGGATPHHVVEDRIAYISGLNWLSTWIDVYFFNKVSDFILGLFILFLVFFMTFYPNKNNLILIKKKNNIKYLIVYFLLIFCFIEWFMNHPALRYGGYHLLALILFIPLCLFLSNFDFNKTIFIKKASILIIITAIIFLARNVSRLFKEYKQYSYNPFISTKFEFNDKFYFRYNQHMIINMSNYPRINFLGKKIIVTKIEQ